MNATRDGDYVRLTYCDRMDLAMAVADFAVSRAGAATVSELAAMGLPAVLVPYAVGNGEQRLNAESLVSAGGAILVLDKDFNLDFVKNQLLPILKDQNRISAMKVAAKLLGITDGASKLVKLINASVKR